MTLTPKKFKRVTLLNYGLEFTFCVGDFVGVVVSVDIFGAEVFYCAEIIRALRFEEGLFVPVDEVGVIDGEDDAGALELR